MVKPAYTKQIKFPAFGAKNDGIENHLHQVNIHTLGQKQANSIFPHAGPFLKFKKAIL